MQNIEAVIKNLPSSKELESLAKDGGEKWNRLVFEKSPYLLQHAANPVDWYPWSDEAFQKAKEENKPVFLSIGYSTCHWCHVMEHESFEDNEVATLLNKNFICIKVDREERPDIDNVYMSFCQMLTGRGGWPLNVFLTSDKKVFHTMTYAPKQSRQVPGGQIPGMLDLIPHIGKLWQEQKEQLIQRAEKILEGCQEDLSDLISGDITNYEESINSVYHKAFTQLTKKFDKEFAGFGQAPKFPSPHIISFLLRYHERFNNDEALNMAVQTLKSMRFGGLFDQIGFGFHRYSTDPQWLLPHFEKMLYDQASQMIAYSEAYKLTQDDFYKNVVAEIFEYISRELQNPLGAFYSAEDADSEGEEGKFYIWTTKEIEEILGNEAETFLDAYNCTKEGNYLDEASHQKTGFNIPHLKNKANHETSRENLFNKRLKRVRPLLDDKILTDWNSLIIVALSKAYAATQDDKYLNSAIKAYEFIEKYLSAGNILFKSYRNGKTSIHAVLGDYAYFIWASIELYQANFETRFLKQAIKTTDIMIEEFWDEKENAFFFSMKSSTELPVNNKEFYDGALASGNSIAVMVLAQLYKITGDDKYNTLGNKLASLMLNLAEKYPTGYTQFLNSLEFYLPDATQVVGVSELSKIALKKYQTEFKPNQTLIYKETAEPGFKEGEVYECQATACKLIIIPPQLQQPAL